MLHYFFAGITYAVKGLLLIFGLFLAYETRSLKVRHINDSRLVAMSIYNVAVLSLITTPVTLVISSQQDALFAFVSLAIIFSSMITMGLVFVPKIVEVVKEGNEKSDRSSAPDGGTTKEEEERYHKLLAENEQLAQILEQVSPLTDILTIRIILGIDLNLIWETERRKVASAASQTGREAFKVGRCGRSKPRRG